MLVSFVGADQFPSILGPRHAASIPLRLDPVKGGRSTKRALEEQERKEAERSMKRRVNLMDEFTRAAGSDADDPEEFEFFWFKKNSNFILLFSMSKP